MNLPYVAILQNSNYLSMGWGEGTYYIVFLIYVGQYNKNTM